MKENIVILVKFFLLLGMLSVFPATASANNETNNLTITNVYVHDCCGRGPYVAAVLSTGVPDPLNCNAVSENNYVATSANSPLANHLLSVALAAKATGATVTIWSKDDCTTTGAFNEWVGIRLE